MINDTEKTLLSDEILSQINGEGVSKGMFYQICILWARPL